MDDTSFFAQPAGHVAVSIEASPGDPNFRNFGQRTDGPKTAEAAALARRNQFATVEEFAAWRRSKGFPELNHWNLVWAWAQFRGVPGENAMHTPILERR